MMYLFISIIYFLTRIPFLRAYPVYYDSFEYVRIIGKVNWHNISSVLSSSHQPIHTFYFLTGLIIKSLLPFVSVELSMTINSLFFGYAICILWFVLLKKISNKKTAVFGTIILLLFPYFFIANTHILYESELLFFQLAAAYVLMVGMEKQKLLLMFFSGLLLGLSHLIFIGTLFVIPIYVYLLSVKLYKKKSVLIVSLLLLILGYCISGLIFDAVLLQSLPLLFAKYASHAGDITSNNQGVFILLGRIVRNIFIQTIAVLSDGGFFLLIFSCMVFFLSKKIKPLKMEEGRWILISSSLLFMIPYFILMQYWHAGFFGRLAIGIIFPSSLIIALSFPQIKFQIVKIAILLLFFVWIPWRQLDPPPIYDYYYLIQNVKHVSIITSDYNRFLYEKYTIPHFLINGNTTQVQIKYYIDSVLNNSTVLIDSSALRYPYFQYDGSTYNILSKNTNGKPLIGNVLDDYAYTEFKKAPYSDIYFLRILSKKK